MLSPFSDSMVMSHEFISADSSHGEDDHEVFSSFGSVTQGDSDSDLDSWAEIENDAHPRR